MDATLFAMGFLVAFLVFALAGAFMGAVYWKQYAVLSAFPETQLDAEEQQLLHHTRGLAIASWIAAAGVVAFGFLVSGVVYYILNSLAKIIQTI
jgi:hypothetical protein